jgi:hypothetical protein
MSEACATASRSSADFPTPAWPRRTSTPLRDSRAAFRSAAIAERSASLPYSIASQRTGPAQPGPHALSSALIVPHLDGARYRLLAVVPGVVEIQTPKVRG